MHRHAVTNWRLVGRFITFVAIGYAVIYAALMMGGILSAGWLDGWPAVRRGQCRCALVLFHACSWQWSAGKAGPKPATGLSGGADHACGLWRDHGAGFYADRLTDVMQQRLTQATVI